MKITIRIHSKNLFLFVFMVYIQSSHETRMDLAHRVEAAMERNQHDRQNNDRLKSLSNCISGPASSYFSHMLLTAKLNNLVNISEICFYFCKPLLQVSTYNKQQTFYNLNDGNHKLLGPMIIKVFTQIFHTSKFLVLHFLL